MRGFLTISAMMAVMTVPAIAADVGSLKGGWVEKGISCQALKDQSDEKIMSITDKKITFYEADCVIRGVKKSGTSYTLKLLCENEGETGSSSFTGKLTGNDTLVVKDGFTYKRCY